MKKILYNCNNDYAFDNGYEDGIQLLKEKIDQEEVIKMIKKARKALNDYGGYLNPEPNDYVVGFNIGIERFLEKLEKEIKTALTNDN